jgi:hypothetical protein
MNPKLLLVGAVLAAVVLGARTSTFQPRSAPVPGDEIPQPATWVPFQADLLVTTPEAPLVRGRFLRGSDGSTRLETGPEGQPDRLVWINNLTQGLSYRRHRGDWSFTELPLPEGGFHPGLFRFRTGMTGLVKLNSPVLVNSQSQLLSSDAHQTTGATAFDAVRYVNPRGNVRILVPELNFFAIVRQDLETGRREVYFNIDVPRTPEPHLFHPPAGASLEPMAIDLPNVGPPGGGMK